MAAVVWTRLISVSFLIRTLRKDSHSQASSTSLDLKTLTVRNSFTYFLNITQFHFVLVFVCLHNLTVFLLVCLFVVYLFVCLFAAYLTVCVYVFLFVCLFICLHICVRQTRVGQEKKFGPTHQYQLHRLQTKFLQKYRIARRKHLLS